MAPLVWYHGVEVVPGVSVVKRMAEESWKGTDRYRNRLATITRVAFLGFCLLVAGTLIASPQKENPPPLASTLKVTTSVVNIYAIVRDNKGHLIPDLNKDDFELREENVPQRIGYFSQETNTPLNLGMVIDTSPSQESLLATEQKEAKEFVRQV